MNDDQFREEVRVLREVNADLLAALIEAEALISKNTYACPDKPQSAWGVLRRVREAIAKDAIAKAKGGPSDA